jgi:hypothetical protein
LGIDKRIIEHDTFAVIISVFKTSDQASENRSRTRAGPAFIAFKF